MLNENQELTQEDETRIQETINRRNKLIEYMRDTKLKQLEKAILKQKEIERVEAKNKADNRKKSKAAKKARKVNRRK